MTSSLTVALWLGSLLLLLVVVVVVVVGVAFAELEVVVITVVPFFKSVLEHICLIK
jgi:hypothetical protein